MNVRPFAVMYLLSITEPKSKRGCQALDVIYNKLALGKANYNIDRSDRLRTEKDIERPKSCIVSALRGVLAFVPVHLARRPLRVS